MKLRRAVHIRVLLIPIFSMLFLASIAWGQAGPAGSNGPAKSPQTEAFDKKALEKLKKISPQEVEALDKKLAQALTLYYDREYAMALSIFREISGIVETMDVLFWYGSCAAKAGETELAIEKFGQMLDIDPDLHRIRLELATVYFGIGRYDDARRELKSVLEAKPPEGVRTNIEKLLAAIDAKTKKLFTNVRLSLGIQRDRNVSSGPDKLSIEIPLGGGTLGPLTNTQRALRDYVAVANLSGNALYDFGGNGSWMWNTTGSFYQTHNLKYYQFDFTQWRVTTGPWWVGRRSILKMPLGYAENVYEHEHLYDTWDFSPSYEYFFTNNLSLRGMVSYARDTYEPTSPPADDRSGQDNINRLWEINPNFYFNNRNDILSFYISGENLNSTDRRFTYTTQNLAVSYFKHFNLFNWDMEFYSRYKYTRKAYPTNALLWPVGYMRTDKRHNFYVVLSRNFWKRFFASLSYNFINNESNTELYDYEKYVYGFSMGFRF